MLSSKIPRNVFVIVILFIVIFVQGGTEGNDDLGCPSTQLVELGGQGFITCTLPGDFSEVHWYDDISGSSDVLAIAVYRLDDNTKDGAGIESGEYDILSNGSLLIGNVTVSHEKQYKALVCTKRSCISLSPISVRVLVYPYEVAPSIAFCNDRNPCVYVFTQRGNLTCRFESARPPVHLEWVEQVRGKDVQIENQNSSNKLNSDDVTYKSYVVLNERVSNDRLLAVYSCKPTWITAGVVMERSILVDFSEPTDLLKQSPEETVYYEINRRSELRCKVSNFTEIIWKKVSSRSKIETVGFMTEHVIHTNEDFADDITLSIDGSLIFTSLQLHHEGTYACLYDNGGDVKGMQISYLQVLVPPSPPYIEIRECKEKSPCVFRGSRDGSLTCVLYGVRPEVSLMWVAANDKLVTLRDFNSTVENRGPLSDISISVNYEVGRDYICGTSVELQCQVGHPISQIIQPFVKAIISPDECTDRGDEGYRRNDVRVVDVITVVAVSVCSIVVACVVIYLLYRAKSNHRTQDQQSTESMFETENLMPSHTNSHVGHLDLQSDADTSEHRADRKEEAPDIKIPLDHCNGNDTRL